jgi:membrane-bound lytic murein transglycosylase B
MRQHLLPASPPGSNSSRRKRPGPAFPKELSTGPSRTSATPPRRSRSTATSAASSCHSSSSCRSAAPTIISQGQETQAANSRLFSCTREEIRRASRSLIAIWGMESGFGRFTGNQHTMSAVATLAYDCRRSAFFTEQLYAQLAADPEGLDFSPISRAPPMAKSARPSFCRPTLCVSALMATAVAASISAPADALASTANFLRGHGWRAAPAISRENQISAPSRAGTPPVCTRRRLPRSAPKSTVAKT